MLTQRIRTCAICLPLRLDNVCNSLHRNFYQVATHRFLFSSSRYQHIESVFEEELFPAKIPIEQRARHWVAMFSMLDDVERKGLNFLFTLKKRCSFYAELGSKFVLLFVTQIYTGC